MEALRESSEKLLGYQDANGDNDEQQTVPIRQSQRKPPGHWQTWSLLASLSLNIGLVIALCIAIASKAALQNIVDSESCSPLYSPALDAVSYEIVTFDAGFAGDETPYQGPPSEENNRLWAELYSPMLTHITPEAARLLPNKTSPEAPYEGSGYLVVLSVFHSLHCLDSIRKAFYYFVDPQWNATHNPYIMMGDGDIESVLMTIHGNQTGLSHLDHCIDALRQSTMCTGDTTPQVFQYSVEDDDMRAFAEVAHKCRDFSKLRDWAVDHNVPHFQGWGDGPELGQCGYQDPAGCLEL